MSFFSSQGLEEYCTLIDSSSSFRAYRAALAEVEPPCIPYLWVHIKPSQVCFWPPQQLQNSFVLQGSYSAGPDLCPPGEPRLHWREGQLLQTLAAVQHSGQHAALPASVRANVQHMKVHSAFVFTTLIEPRTRLISGIMSWSGTKTSFPSSTTSATTWQKRPCGSCRWRSSPGT